MFTRRKKHDKIPFNEMLSLFFVSLKKLWKYDKKYVFFTFLYFVLGIFPVLLNAFVVATFNQKIMEGSEVNSDYWLVFYPLLISFAVALLYGIWGSISMLFNEKCQNHITALILRESADKARKIDYFVYDTPEFHDMIQKGWSEDGTMLVSSAKTVFETIRSVTGIIGYISILAVIDWRLMIVFTLFRIAINPIVNEVNGMNYRLNNRLAETRRKEQYYRNFFDNKEKASEGKIFDLYEYAQKNFFESHQKVYKETFIHTIKVNSVNLLAYTIHSLPLSIIYIYMSVGVYNGSISLANMTMFVSSYMGFINQVYNTLNKLSGIRNYAESSRYAREFSKISNTIFTDDDHTKEKILLNTPDFIVEFCNVSFQYPNADRKVLDNVSFKVYGNELVTIIGDNGAGKTTLIHLLIRIYDPTEGQILLNGRNLKNYSVESLYNLYGVLFQDYCNYETSARESITLTTETCSSDMLNFSLCASTADHFISELKEGIDTQLTRKYHENGIELSVGQKQRVALARAYYKNAPVIILDEPSASIDPISEAEIYANIINQKGSKSIWLISHRLSTCVVSDRVLFLKDGKLIGNGSHDDLFKTNNEYRRVFMLQAEKYEVL